MPDDVSVVPAGESDVLVSGVVVSPVEPLDPVLVGAEVVGSVCSPLLVVSAALVVSPESPLGKQATRVSASAAACRRG